MRDTGRRRYSKRNIDFSSIDSQGNTDDFDISKLLKEDSNSASDSSDSRNLENIFKKKLTNPFNNIEERNKIASQSRELEEIVKSDNSVIYTTGYSIHMLTPYVLGICIFCFGFILLDMYKFNIFEYLSHDIRYKIPAYGILCLLLMIVIYFFIKKSLAYANLKIEITKYKIVQGSRRTTKKTDIHLYTIQELVNDKGIFGRLLNYGNLTFYLNTRRSIVFEKLHYAQYVYDLIDKLQHKDYSSFSEQNDEISSLIDSSNKEEHDTVEEDSNEEYSGLDLSDLGFTEEELASMGMLSSPSTKTSERKIPERKNRRR